jgi:hypothetical protein
MSTFYRDKLDALAQELWATSVRQVSVPAYDSVRRCDLVRVLRPLLLSGAGYTMGECWKIAKPVGYSYTAMKAHVERWGRMAEYRGDNDKARPPGLAKVLNREEERHWDSAQISIKQPPKSFEQAKAKPAAGRIDKVLRMMKTQERVIEKARGRLTQLTLELVQLRGEE